MSDRLIVGRVRGTVAEVVDAGHDLLPDFEMAMIAALEGMERPAEWPQIRRRLRAEGVRPVHHRGVLLLSPGDLEHVSSVGMLAGGDEVVLVSEWNDEVEPFPGHLTSDHSHFEREAPLGLEEWMLDVGGVLALGDGDGLNFATLDQEIADRIAGRFPAVSG